MALIYWVAYPAAGSKPSAAQIIAGQDATGSAAAASGSKVELGSDGTWTDSITGLSAGTQYKAAAVHADGGDAGVVETAGWWTDNSGAVAATLGAATLAAAGALEITGQCGAVLDDAILASYGGGPLADLIGALAVALDDATLDARGTDQVLRAMPGWTVYARARASVARSSARNYTVRHP